MWDFVLRQCINSVDIAFKETETNFSLMQQQQQQQELAVLFWNVCQRNLPPI
jgi:hypothetical protein